MRKNYLIFLYVLILSFSTSFLQNPKMMSYVEVNSNDLSAVGCYVRSDNGKPFFDFTSIFAANINGRLPNKPEIYFNPQVHELILRNHKKIEKLQSQGIKVLVTLLGNHFNAGWCCMTDQSAIEKFADDIAEMLIKFNLDGADIDDEYSTCVPNRTSLNLIVKAFKNNLKSQGKLITIALWNNLYYLEDNDLPKNLDYGWEMSYSGPYDRLKPYADAGFSKDKLYLGLHFEDSNAESYLNLIKNNNYGGLMFYDVKKNGEENLSNYTRILYGNDVNVKNICNEKEKIEEGFLKFLE